MLYDLAGINPLLYPDGKIPKELEGVTLHEYERNKMETLLQVVSKWEREDAWIIIYRLLIIQIYEQLPHLRGDR